MLSLRKAALTAARAPAVHARWLKILAADPVDPICGEVFKDNGHKLVEKKLSRDELLATIGQYDGLVVRSGVKVTEEVLRHGTKLKIVGRAGAGVDNVDTVAATRRGVIVMNTPGGNTSAAAELTMSLLTSMVRQIPAAVQSLKGGVWDRKTFSKGVELKGKTIGVVGLGMIGAEVARRCQALDMVTLGFDPLVSEDKAAALGVKKVTLDQLYAAADVVTLHTPLNDATRNLISKASLSKCKDGVFVINCARGGIVHEGDLLEALNSGKVAGAALDVFDTEPPSGPASLALIAHPKVLCTPHLGASTEEAQMKVAREIAQQMSDAFATRGFVGVVNGRHLALAHKPALEPFVRLSEALGSLQGQVWAGGPVKACSVEVDVEGPVFAAEAGGAVGDLVKASVLRGLLPALAGADVEAGDVNLVNAAFLAAEAHLKVAVRVAPASAGPYANAVRVSVVSPAGERTVVGAVIEGKPRVVQVDHWAAFPSFAPAGHVLFFNNIDKPGSVGRVTSVLADNNINIASLSIARQYPGSPALSVIMSDQRVSAEVKARIEALEGISGVRTASFDPAIMGPVAGAGGAAAAEVVA